MANYPLETLVPSCDGDDEARALIDPRLPSLLEFGEDVEEWTAGAELSAEYLRRNCVISQDKSKINCSKTTG